MRQNITTGDIPFRKAWIRSIIERIEVGDGVIRIIGDKSALEQAVDGKPGASGGVRRCVRRWHATRIDTANSHVIEIEICFNTLRLRPALTVGRRGEHKGEINLITGVIKFFDGRLDGPNAGSRASSARRFPLFCDMTV